MSQIPAPAAAQQSPIQLAAPWAGVLTRDELPADLTWSGKQPLPAIGERVYIRMNDFGAAVVNHYFHADGFLGVICTPDVLPEWFQKQNRGITKGHFFGVELGPMPAEVPLSVLEAREVQAKRYYNATQREARRAYPYDPEQRKAHCEQAKQAWQRAIECVDQARQRAAGSGDTAPA